MAIYDSRFVPNEEHINLMSIEDRDEVIRGLTEIDHFHDYNFDETSEQRKLFLRMAKLLNVDEDNENIECYDDFFMALITVAGYRGISVRYKDDECDEGFYEFSPMRWAVNDEYIPDVYWGSYQEEIEEAQRKGLTQEDLMGFGFDNIEEVNEYIEKYLYEI